MEYFAVHEHHVSIQLDKLNDENVRIRFTRGNMLFSRNSIVKIKNPQTGCKVYRIIQGAFSEKLNGNQVLITYGTYNYLELTHDAIVELHETNWLERNVLFYLDNPDPRTRHKSIRDFAITVMALIVSVLQIITFVIDLIN